MTYRLEDILSRHWLFGSLPERTRSDLISKFSIKKYQMKNYVFHQDDLAERLYVILDGEISVETTSMSGKTTKITHLSKGEIFGEFALIDEGLRSASAIIVRPTTLASLSAQAFHQIMEEQPEFAKSLLCVLVAHIRQSNQQIESLVTLSLLQRTARLLLQLAKTEGDLINITQQQIGERLFASREKVNIKLKKLEQLGAISTGHGKIQIHNTEHLARIVDADDDI